MTETVDSKFMRRCIDLAQLAEGMTYPNPMVGSVIVNKGKIIGEGFHLRAGTPHAEVNAVNAVSDKGLLRDSVIYVNLEPCSHFGKTPPCADMIIAAGIPKVVIATTDTSHKVAGKGIEKLRNAGCEVVTGTLEEEARRLNRRFFTFHEKKRPYITLKWAESGDGFIDMQRGENFSREPNWITGKPERVLVHRWRSAEEAILVGAGTVRCDNPRLNVRYWTGNDPLRIILSGSGEAAALFSCEAGDESQVVIFTGNDVPVEAGVEKVLLGVERPASFQIADYLAGRGIQSLFVEGGAMTLNHFLTTGCWDEARVFRGSVKFKGGVRAPVIKGEPASSVRFSMSRLDQYFNIWHGESSGPVQAIPMH